MDDLSVEEESLAAHLHTPCRLLVSPGTNAAAAVAGFLDGSPHNPASCAAHRLACVPALRIAVATRHRGLHVYPLPGRQAACAGESADGFFVVTRLLADGASDITPVALVPHPLRVDGNPVVLAVVAVHSDEGAKMTSKGQNAPSGDGDHLTGHAQKRSLLALDANALARGEAKFLAVPSALDCTRMCVSPSGDYPSNSGNGLADDSSVIGLDAPRDASQAAVALADGRALLVSFGHAATSPSYTIHEPAAHAGARAVAVAAEFSAYRGTISTSHSESPSLVVAIGTDRGDVHVHLLPSAASTDRTASKSSLCAPRDLPIRIIPALESGWTPAHLAFFAPDALFVSYQRCDEPHDCRHVVWKLGQDAVPTGDRSALGELIYPLPPDDDAGSDQHGESQRRVPITQAVMTAVIPTWDLAIVGSSSSAEIELVGYGPADSSIATGLDDEDEDSPGKERVPEIDRLSLHSERENSGRRTGRWCNWKLDEGQTIATPSDDAYNDTLPVGIALDLCDLTTAEVEIGSDEAPERLHRKQMPALLVLSSAGVLLSFALIDDRPGAKCDAVGPPSFPSLSPPTGPSSRTAGEQVDKSNFNFQERLNIENDSYHLSDVIRENRKNDVDSSKDNSWAARKHGFQSGNSDSSEESDEGDESDVEKSMGDDSDEVYVKGSDSEYQVRPDSRTELDDNKFISGDSFVEEHMAPHQLANKDLLRATEKSMSITASQIDPQNGTEECLTSTFPATLDRSANNSRESDFVNNRKIERRSEPFTSDAAIRAFDIQIVDSDMKKLMVPRLKSALVAADHAEPTSQVRSILLEMDEEIASVRRVEGRMRSILKKASGFVTGDAHLEHCAEINAVRKTMRDYIGYHENMHEQASKSLKAVISIGKDIEETIFLSKANDVNRKYGFSGQMNANPLLWGSSVYPAPESQLSPDIVQIDRDLDTKEVEIVRALNAIEEKTEFSNRRPASLARAFAKSSISLGPSSYMMRDNASDRVKMVKQLHSSLSLHEARIKRLLVMLKAMEAELREHRRLLGGHRGADIGLSHARLEKLSLSGPDVEGDPTRLKECRSSSASKTRNISNVPDPSLQRVYGGVEMTRRGPLDAVSSDTYRTLREIAMKGGRERVTLHPTNVSSLLGSSSETGLPEAPAIARTYEPVMERLPDSSHTIEGHNATPLSSSLHSSREMFGSTRIVRGGTRFDMATTDSRPDQRQDGKQNPLTSSAKWQKPIVLSSGRESLCLSMREDRDWVSQDAQSTLGLAGKVAVQSHGAEVRQERNNDSFQLPRLQNCLLSEPKSDPMPGAASGLSSSKTALFSSRMSGTNSPPSPVNGSPVPSSDDRPDGFGKQVAIPRASLPPDCSEYNNSSPNFGSNPLARSNRTVPSLSSAQVGNFGPEARSKVESQDSDSDSGSDTRLSVNSIGRSMEHQALPGSSNIMGNGKRDTWTLFSASTSEAEQINSKEIDQRTSHKSPSSSDLRLGSSLLGTSQPDHDSHDISSKCASPFDHSSLVSEHVDKTTSTTSTTMGQASASPGETNFRPSQNSADVLKGDSSSGVGTIATSHSAAGTIATSHSVKLNPSPYTPGQSSILETASPFGEGFCNFSTSSQLKLTSGGSPAGSAGIAAAGTSGLKGTTSWTMPPVVGPSPFGTAAFGAPAMPSSFTVPPSNPSSSPSFGNTGPVVSFGAPSKPGAAVLPSSTFGAGSALGSSAPYTPSFGSTTPFGFESQMFGSIPPVFAHRNSGPTDFSAIAAAAGPPAFGLASQSQPAGFAATGEGSGFGNADANSLFDNSDANSSGFGGFGAQTQSNTGGNTFTSPAFTQRRA